MSDVSTGFVKSPQVERKRKRKRKIAVVTVTVLLLAVGSAFAYWAILYSGGSGSGSEPNASNGGVAMQQQAVSFTVSWPSGQLAPGVTVPLTILSTNLVNPPDGVSLGPITATVTSTDPQCDTSQFHISQPSGYNWALTGIATVPAGATNAVLGVFDGATLSMSDTNSQQSCVGSTIQVAINAVATPN